MAPRAFESRRFGPTNRVGGLFNRDDYAIVPSRRDPDQLWLDRRYRHPTEHWADHDEVRQLLDVCVIRQSAQAASAPDPEKR